MPDALLRRLLSVRTHDRAGRMLECDVAPGDELVELAGRLLAIPEAHELHVHPARADSSGTERLQRPAHGDAEQG